MSNATEETQKLVLTALSGGQIVATVDPTTLAKEAKQDTEIARLTSILADLDVLAHARSAAVVYFTAKTLPAAGAATDPNGGTLGDGLAIPVPSWAVNATIFVEYALGAGASGGTASALVFVAPSIPGVLVALGATGAGSIDPDGAAILAAGIAGVAAIGCSFAENGDTAHPGIINVNVVFSR